MEGVYGLFKFLSFPQGTQIVAFNILSCLQLHLTVFFISRLGGDLSTSEPNSLFLYLRDLLTGRLILHGVLACAQREQPWN